MSDQGDDLLARLIVKAGEPLAVAKTVPAPRATAVLEAVGVPSALEIDAGSSARPSPKGPPPGTAARFGRYEVVGEIGAGAAGIVLEGRDPELCRKVAIKVLRSEHVDREIIERFVSEAQVTAQLEHPGIVPVHDFGITPDGRLYLVMKRVHGRSLLEVLGALAHGDEATLRQWPVHRRLAAFIQVCRAVAYAHDRGVVHRDLKPANLMFGAFGEALVMDWGIARVMKSAAEPVDRFNTHNTAEGRMMGTPGYMSPEQMLGAQAQLGPPSDVWSLGVILYELLTVQLAFTGTHDEISLRVTTGPLTTERWPPSHVPVALGQVISMATSVRTQKRFATAAQLADAVDAFYTR